MAPLTVVLRSAQDCVNAGLEQNKSLPTCRQILEMIVPSLTRGPDRIRPGDFLLVVAAALPVLFLAMLVYQYAVPIPMLDDWDMAPLIAKWRTGGLTFHDFWVQQQESRTFFPKIIFVLLAAGPRWDVRLEMVLSIVTCLATAVGIHALLRNSQMSRLHGGGAFLLIVLLLFSPVQHELWLLASGFPSFVPALCIVGGLVVALSRLTTVKKFTLCALLALFSSFTLSNGLLAWGLTFPVALLIGRIRGWRPWLGWFTLSAVCSFFYFYGFTPQPDLPAFAPPRPVLDYLQYLLAFLGSALGRAGNGDPLTTSIGVGVIALLAYVSALIYAFVYYRDRELLSRLAPWFALGLYSIACGILAALGRIAWGVSQALESRYVAFSLYLLVAVIVLLGLISRHFRERTQTYAARVAVLSAIVLLGAVYLTLHVRCATASLEMFRIRSANTRLGYGAVIFSPVLETSSILEKVSYPRPNFVRKNADLLDQLHLLRPPLIRTTDISQLRTGKADGTVASGWFDSTKAQDEQITASGWAALIGKRRPADCVILAFSEEGTWRIFAMSSAVVARPDVAEKLHDSRYRWTGWHAVYPANIVPPGARVSAWALDARDAKLYELYIVSGKSGP